MSKITHRNTTNTFYSLPKTHQNNRPQNSVDIQHGGYTTYEVLESGFANCKIRGEINLSFNKFPFI